MEPMGFQKHLKMEESSPIWSVRFTLRLHLSAHQDMVSYKEFITWALERWMRSAGWWLDHHAAGGWVPTKVTPPEGSNHGSPEHGPPRITEIPILETHNFQGSYIVTGL